MNTFSERLIVASEIDDSQAVVKILKTKLADINGTDFAGRTPILLAAAGKMNNYKTVVI